MKLYHRDPETGEYTEARDAQLDRRGRPITDVLFAVPDAPGSAKEGLPRYGFRRARMENTLRKLLRCQPRVQGEAGTT